MGFNQDANGILVYAGTATAFGARSKAKYIPFNGTGNLPDSSNPTTSLEKPFLLVKKKVDYFNIGGSPVFLGIVHQCLLVLGIMIGIEIGIFH